MTPSATIHSFFELPPSAESVQPVTIRGESIPLQPHPMIWSVVGLGACVVQCCNRKYLVEALQILKFLSAPLAFEGRGHIRSGLVGLPSI